VPENSLKYAVGLLLATFGTFLAVEGLGVFADESLEWPGGDLAPARTPRRVVRVLPTRRALNPALIHDVALAQ
jgi:uncharacterized membrane protein